LLLPAVAAAACLPACLLLLLLALVVVVMLLLLLKHAMEVTLLPHSLACSRGSCHFIARVCVRPRAPI
jgi:hypothetical protein